MSTTHLKRTIYNQRKLRKSKYRSKKEQIDGVIFDSQKEARDYQCLKIRERIGEISGLKLQPKYCLVPSFKYNDKIIRGVWYTADFEFFDRKLNKIVTREVKGYKTPVYIIKKKLFLLKYPDHVFQEV